MTSRLSLKRKQKNGEVYQPLLGKTIGLIFEKSSTRTRVSFEVGMYQLGGHALFLSKNDIQLGRGETVGDTAQVMSRYLNGIMIRTFGHDKVEDLARYASVPVINGLSDLAHPCQVLADYQTVYEHKGKLKGLKLAYIGDGNNMAHSLLIGGAKLGVHVAVAGPEGYEPDEAVVAEAREIAKETGSVITVTRSPQEAVQDADVIYTDVWASMGFEAEQLAREAAFKDYQVNEEPGERREERLSVPALPAGPPGGRGQHRRHRRPEFRDLRSGGEPPACAEGAYGGFDGLDADVA